MLESKGASFAECLQRAEDGAGDGSRLQAQGASARALGIGHWSVGLFVTGSSRFPQSRLPKARPVDTVATRSCPHHPVCCRRVCQVRVPVMVITGTQSAGKTTFIDARCCPRVRRTRASAFDARGKLGRAIGVWPTLHLRTKEAMVGFPVGFTDRRLVGPDTRRGTAVDGVVKRSPVGKEEPTEVK